MKSISLARLAFCLFVFGCIGSRGVQAGVCALAVQGQVAWDYNGNVSWSSGNIDRLCRGATDSDQPAQCFQQVMHGGVDWGGGTQWQWNNVIDLCEGSLSAANTVGCFQEQVGAGATWDQAIASCDERNQGNTAAAAPAAAPAPAPVAAPPPAASDVSTSTAVAVPETAPVEPLKTTTPVMDKTTAQVLGASTEPDICWKDSYGRGVGEVPNSCRDGFERTGADLLCYEKCNSGFYGVGPVCWQDCPAGYRNDGGHCAKPEAYGRGAGYPWEFGDPAFKGDGQIARCERDNGAGNCEQDGALYYPKCRPGFHKVGCCICTPDCPAGMVDIGVSCQKQSYGRGVGEGAFCSNDQEQDFQGGLCYPKCKPGTSGVGPLCWSGCPSDYPVNCGAACGVSESACAFAIMEQVQSSTDVALNVVALVTTAGAGNAALKSARLAGKSAQKSLTKAARKQLREQAKDQALNGLKWMKRNKRVGNVQGWLEKGENVEKYSEMMVDAYEKGEFDFTQLAPSVADVEPTGVLSVVNAFNKPICGR